MSRMTTTTTPLAVAADYADALMTARRARRWLFFLLMVMISAQIAVFLLAHFGFLKFGDSPDAPATNISLSASATQPITTQPAETKPADAKPAGVTLNA